MKNVCIPEENHNIIRLDESQNFLKNLPLKILSKNSKNRGDVISFHKLRERLNLDIMTNINDIRKLTDMEKNKKKKEELGKLLKYAEKSGITAHHTNCHHKISFKNAKVV